jgi:cell wall-associated NlpC family hydrolase
MMGAAAVPAEAIIAAARECLGTPFRHQGRLLGEGLDCAGVAVHVGRRVGCEVLDVPGYGRTPAGGLLELALAAQGCLDEVAIADRRPGDLLLMRFDGDPQHLAILADGTLIHAYESVGKCCEHRLSSSWAARIQRAYRFVFRGAA